MTRFGFTGTQDDLTPEQLGSLRGVFGLAALTENVTEFHHGDCVGADAAAHDVAVTCGWPTHGHPTNIEGKRAFKRCDVTYPALDPLVRNQVIVDSIDQLVACPGEMHEVQRSGTWATVRRARKAGIPIVYCYPDGSIEEES